MKILIAGDLVLHRQYTASNLSSDVLDLFRESDLNIVNLEAPVTTSSAKITKTGPHLKADYQGTVNVVEALRLHVATLANNHILDYDQQGVIDTLEFCKEMGIQSVGAGKNLDQAEETLYIDSAEGRIAIVNFSENEWASATKSTAGANPMSTIDNHKQIKEAKKASDLVIVIVHGGNEYNIYPSPRMSKLYRFYVESGADMVIGHHTHCIGGYEIYQKKPIFYSLGNFLFTSSTQKSESWYSGLVVKAEIHKKGEILDFDIIPTIQEKDSFSLDLAKSEEKEKILEAIKDINEVINDEDALQEKWLDFVENKRGGYMKALSPIAGFSSSYLRAFFYRTGIYKWFLNKKYASEMVNRMRCEAHHDVVKDMFKKYINK